MARYLEWASVGTRRVGFALLVALFAACSSNGGDTGDAGNGGDGGDGAVVVGGCDTSKLPTEDPCVVGDAEGVFVSSSLGSANGDGTKAHPFASLQAGIVAASPTKKRVYACAETYAEAITLASGVSVFGYFDCAQGWAVGTSHAKVKPTTSPAATASNLTAPTRLEAVDLIAPDFADQSQSSIGLLVTGSPSLTVANATIHAGTGGKGADGAPGTLLTDSGTAKNGASSAWNRFVCAGTLCTGIVIQQVGGSLGGTNSCAGASGHAGGSGGNGGTAGEFQALTFDNGISWHWATQSSYPCTGGGVNPATAQTALGGATGSMNATPNSVSVIPGGAGADGSPGASGSAGASGGAVGAFSATGYAPSDGTAGGDGQPGQGGGGGGAFALQYNFDPDYAPGSYQNDYGNGEAGAGGGAGGCPGLAGQAGKGGGASVGVIALQSAFTLINAKIEASAGGNGGAAGTPSNPSAGGTGGSPKQYAGKGGNGGAGGPAGASGSGGGGPSIGIAYQGTQPTLTGSTVAQGQGGAGVAQAPSSPAGLSKDLYSF